LSHFLLMVAFALAVSVVFGVTGRKGIKERFRYGLKVFVEFVGVGLALAWLLYLLP
jgi:hypothetical protein